MHKWQGLTAFINGDEKLSGGNINFLWWCKLKFDILMKSKVVSWYVLHNDVDVVYDDQGVPFCN